MYNCRISYVRFDGSMSARKRQETLERFCVPLEDETTPVPSQSDKSNRRARSTKASCKGADLDRDDEDDFIDDGNQDDDVVFVSQSKKGKGKGKAKANKTAYERLLSSFENPQVMLISLKAGALGLNLTVANNVYL